MLLNVKTSLEIHMYHCYIFFISMQNLPNLLKLTVVFVISSIKDLLKSKSHTIMVQLYNVPSDVIV